jgi:hypothetical protein
MAFSTASCWKPVTRNDPEMPLLLSAISLRRSMMARMTVVFPVPGGPWISAMSGVLRVLL